MKRLFSIGLLAVFTLATVGVVLNSYSCKMMKTEMSKCCSKNNKNCCERQVKLLKVKDDFVSSSYHTISKVVCENVLLLYSPDAIANHFPIAPFSALKDHAPPEPTVDRLSFIQSFLI